MTDVPVYAALIHSIATMTLREMRIRHADMSETLRAVERSDPDQSYIIMIKDKDIAVQLGMENGVVKAKPCEVDKATLLPRNVANHIRDELLKIQQADTDLPEAIRYELVSLPAAAALKNLVALVEKHVAGMEEANAALKKEFGL